MSKLWMAALGIGVVLAALGCSASESSADAPNGQAQQGQTDGKSDASNAVSVKAVQVQRQALQAWIYTQGTARSRQREFLTFIEQGLVSHVDETLRIGSAVKAGQLIANQAPERFQANLQAARAALAQAQANLALAEVTQQRYESLTAQRSASKQELDEAVVQVQQAKAARDNARAELAQAQLSVADSRLVSPIDGVLARLNIEKGRYFLPTTLQTGNEQDALRTIAALVINPDLFEVRVDLPSYDFRRISLGAKAVIGSSPPSNGQDLDPHRREQQIQGQVHAFSPSLDPETRTFEVLVYTHSGQAGLQDGEFVAVWIAEPGLEQTLAVPMEAVRFRNDQSFVFVVNEAGDKVAERRVELGQQSGDYRAVLQGLEQGEWVVTDGRAALQDGQAVRLLNSAAEGKP